MESGVVEHDDRARIQGRHELLLQPQVKRVGVACAFEQERRCEFFADQSRYQAGARAAMAGTKAMHTLAARSVAIVALCRALKAGFIDVNERAPLLRQLVMTFQITAADVFIVQRFFIPPRFFYGSTSSAASRS